MKVGILNGPNLNLLGKREPEIYGEKGFTAFLDQLRLSFPEVELSYFQSNEEGKLVDALHLMAQDCQGIIFNPAAFTHTSIALADAAKAVDCPIIEVHISNVYQRESFRHKSYISAAAMGTITGLGLQGYALALRALINK
ncbi:MAG: type II 3-dehydroquinate dehydratase [Croceimicrobium sp.]|nr:type II 3-dehydroquinate dehydratase [Bacteroidota bacterium]